MISEINGVKNYKASRNAMMALYTLVGAICFLSLSLSIASAVLGERGFFSRLLISISVYVLLLGAVLPKFFKNNHLSISREDIVCVRGLVTDRKIYMPMAAVRSVSMVVTPFGNYTGLNFVVINALGSRLIAVFLTKDDCIDICAYINEIIMNRPADE